MASQKLTNSNQLDKEQLHSITYLGFSPITSS